jgi:hypothetical protein
VRDSLSSENISTDETDRIQPLWIDSVKTCDAKAVG